MTPSLNRRDFVKTAVAGLAGAVCTEGSMASTAGSQRQILALENDHILWEFSNSNQRVVSSGLKNKLSGRHFPLSTVTELGLVLSAAKERIEIPWWRCWFGPDNDTTDEASEQGQTKGFSQRTFDDAKWKTCSNLGLRGLASDASLTMNQNRPPVVFRGYGWFRTKVELSPSARGNDIFFNLGGYDETDWKKYWVYVNGNEVGQRNSSGRWPSPGMFHIAPGSPAYETLRFGLGDANVVAVRTYAYDRHYGGLSDDILDRHIFDPVLHDQFLSVGDPYLTIDEFHIAEITQDKQGAIPSLTAKLVNTSSQIQATLHYELEGTIRRKWAEILNGGKQSVLLLDVHLDTFRIDGALEEGGYGFPLTIDNQLFAAVEHPSGFNRWQEDTVRITHFPGRWLKPGESWRTNSAIVGVARDGQANRQFLEYIEAHTVRKEKILALYDPFGVTSFTDGTSWALNEEQNSGTLDVLEQWQKRGVKFDHYVPDMSLDTTSDLKRFRLFSFPDGPAATIERVNNLGMKFGQWFCVTMGAWSNGRNPKMAPSKIPSPTQSSYALFRNGYLADMFGGVSDLCVASEPYFSTLRDAVVHHIKENHIELVKFDAGDYYCNSTQHGHLPGKYSTEESLNRLVELARAAHAANPEVFINWYWGAYSPFLALHGDVIFDIRISMEAASTGDYPALFFRDAVTQALDQGSQYARWVPTKNHDSLGVWMANNWWGNQMGTVRWQEALVMDLARGNMLFPQIWGDINNLEEHDVDFLARLQRLVKDNESTFLMRRYTIGDAWRDDIYGYSYFQGTHGFIFLNNVSFDSRRVRLALDETIGLKTRQSDRLQMRMHHPLETDLTRNGSQSFEAGEEIDIQLRPFEVAMIEVTPSGRAASLPQRELLESSPPYSYALPLREISGQPDLEIYFADSASLESRNLKKRTHAFEGTLPNYEGGRYHVAVVCTFSREGRKWRQSKMNELVQAIGEIDGAVIEFTATPEYRQIGNNQWNSWMVFSAPLPTAFAGHDVRFGINAYLPEDVEVNTKLWVVKEWWKPRRRSLPNYWV